MILQKLKSKQLVNCPEWIPDNVHYMTIMGSVAYGVSSDNSDNDVYGFCIPKKDDVFPHLRGEIPGFGRQIKRFEVWQQHGIIEPGSKKEYDFQVYSIIKYFQLCMDNNPNMIDSLFTPQRCVLHSTNIGNMIRDNRAIFLHKGCWHRFKGYAYSQMNKADTKTQKDEIVDLRKFEKDNNISHETTYQEVLEEIKKRNLNAR